MVSRRLRATGAALLLLLVAAALGGCRGKAHERTAETKGMSGGEAPAGKEERAMEKKGMEAGGRVKLPAPHTDGGMTLNRALLLRRSVREYSDMPLTLAELSQLLWSAQGITRAGLFRTSPSAGATYPLEVYVAVGDVTGLAPGVYRYEPAPHELAPVAEGDVRNALSAACLGQNMVRDAVVSIVFAADFARTTGRYGQRGVMYVHQETGHAGQNIYLQATALGLATVAVGAFEDAEVSRVLRLPKNHHPLCVFPVGRP